MGERRSHLNRAVGKAVELTLHAFPSKDLRNQVRSALYRVRGGWPPGCLAEAGETVVQVGTPNPRTVRALLDSCGETGTVVVVEAVRKNYRRLVAASERLPAGIRQALLVVNKAAFSRPGKVEIALSSVYDGDHMITGLDTVMDNLDRVGASFSRIETVQADTLDNILLELDRPDPDLIIVTVNGAEHEVLRGAKNTLARMRGGARVFAKAHARRGAGTTLAGEITALLGQAGFHTVRTRRTRSVSQDPEWPFREGDVFAYKRY